MSDVTLKPCPFCGSIPIITIDEGEAALGCTSCGLAVVHYSALEGPLIAAWNTRPSNLEAIAGDGGADPSFPDALNDNEVRIWINACNHQPAKQALRQLLAYRVRGHAAPVTQPAGDGARNAVLEEAAVAVELLPETRLQMPDDIIPDGDDNVLSIKRGDLVLEPGRAAFANAIRALKSPIGVEMGETE